MTYVGLAWSNTSGSDIHLLPGLVSPELTRLLSADDEDPATHVITEKPLHQIAGLTMAFSAQLWGPPTDHGLTISTTTTGSTKATGEVTVDTAAMKGRSFILTATGTVPAAGGHPAVTFTARTRVVVHGSLEKLWLTPKQLTVRKGAKNVRLSVLAQFDDGVIADITHWAPFETPLGPTVHTYVRAKGSDTPVLQWSAESIPPGGAAVATVDPATGVLNATAEAGSTKISVAFGAKTASATVVCAQPWSTPVRLTLLPGSRGVRDINFVPNILFLPDGFQEKDKSDYERMVRLVVTRLSTRNRTRPYAAFTGRINYFMGWVPSPDAGISVLNELDRTNKTTTSADGELVPLPSVTRRAPPNWKLDELINAVGLPTPVGDPDASPLDDARITAWQSTYGTFITKNAVQPLYAKWLALNDRVLLNECDTAFHMAFGTRPALDQTTPEHGIAPNVRRLDNDDLNTFLDALVDEKGGPLNKLWTTGKDRALVAVLCRSLRIGGENTGRSVGASADAHTLGVSLGDRLVHRMQPNKDGNGFDLVPDAVPTEVFYSVWLVVAHEFAHSWGLGDEYGGIAGGPTATRIPDIRADANIQLRADLVDAAGNIGPIDVIKWGAWPRVAKGGVLAIAPAPAAGGKFRFTLTDGKASGFRPGDLVRVRTRPLATAGPPSVRLKVESATGDTLIAAPLGAAVFDATKFPAGSVVIAPVRAKDPDPAAGKFGDDLTLANEDVLIRIATTGNPLNAEPGPLEAPPPNANMNRPCVDVYDQAAVTPAKNFPSRKAPKPPAFSAWTIGLYEWGGGFTCGVYHPTGVCIMNVQTQSNPKTSDVNLYEFCLICRYAIVDMVDPTVYGAVEDDYRERYT